jgi:hypothetical protein
LYVQVDHGRFRSGWLEQSSLSRGERSFEAILDKKLDKRNFRPKIELAENLESYVRIPTRGPKACTTLSLCGDAIREAEGQRDTLSFLGTT